MPLPRHLLDRLTEEYDRACVIHTPPVSAHEGFDAVDEEHDELEVEVHKKRTNQDKDKMITEAFHVAVTALRFAGEVRRWREVRPEPCYGCNGLRCSFCCKLPDGTMSMWDGRIGG